MRNYSPEELLPESVLPLIRPFRCRAGDTIYTEGEPTSRLTYLSDGRIQCYVSQRNGVISAVDLVTAPCFLGELEFFGVQAEASGVRAVSDCAGWVVDYSLCRDALLADASFLRAMCCYGCEKAKRISRAAARNQSYRLRNRLATYILHTQQNGLYRESHALAVAYLGVTYRHYLYVIAQFIDEGLLEKTPQGCRILDLPRLSELALDDEDE